MTTKRIMILVAGLLLALGGQAAAQGNQDARTLYLGATGAACRLSNDSSGTPVLVNCDLNVSGYVGVPGFASQTTGWRVTATGALDVRYLYSDELRVKLFTAEVESVLAGSQRITKSYSTVSQTFTCPALGGSSTLWVKDATTYSNAAVFDPAGGDAVSIRSQSRTAMGPFTVADCVGFVYSYTDGTGANDGQQAWAFNRSATSGYAGSMTGGTTIPVDTLALDYGVTGNGFMETTAVDGAANVNAPYIQAATWTFAPTSTQIQPRCRLGNLKGITTVAEYGLYCGNLGLHYIRVSDQNADIVGIPVRLFNASNVETMRLDSAGPSFAMGPTLPADFYTGVGCWQGNNGGVYVWRCGDPAGSNVNWDGTNVNVSGLINAAGGAIGGYTIGADYIRDAANTMGLASTVTGGDDTRFWAGDTYANRASAPFRVTESGVAVFGGFVVGPDYVVGTNVGLASTISGGNDTRIWAGDTFVNRASAPFRVFENGAFVATNATITGAITATSGSFAGDGSAVTNIDGGHIQASTIVAGALSVSTLSAITADLGSVTAGQIVVGSSDKLWLNDSADGELHIGGSTKASAPFSVGSTGQMTATGAILTGGASFNGGFASLVTFNIPFVMTNFVGGGSTNACIDNSGFLYRC